MSLHLNVSKCKVIAHPYTIMRLRFELLDLCALYKLNYYYYYNASSSSVNYCYCTSLYHHS